MGVRAVQGNKSNYVRKIRTILQRFSVITKFFGIFTKRTPNGCPYERNASFTIHPTAQMSLPGRRGHDPALRNLPAKFQITERYRAVPNSPSITDHPSTHYPRALPAKFQFVTDAECCLPGSGLFVQRDSSISHKKLLTKLANLTIIPP